MKGSPASFWTVLKKVLDVEFYLVLFLVLHYIWVLVMDTLTWRLIIKSVKICLLASVREYSMTQLLLSSENIWITRPIIQYFPLVYKKKIRWIQVTVGECSSSNPSLRASCYICNINHDIAGQIDLEKYLK